MGDKTNASTYEQVREIGMRSEDFEKIVVLLKTILDPIEFKDFEQGFQIILECNPEPLETKFKYFKPISE